MIFPLTESILIGIVVFILAAAAVVIIIRSLGQPDFAASSSSDGKSRKSNLRQVTKQIEIAKNLSIYELPSSFDFFQIMEGSESQGEDINQRLALISKQLTVNQDALKSFFRSARRLNISPEKLPGKLINNALKYHELRGEVVSEKISDPELAKMNQEALGAIETGNSKVADEKLSRIEEAFLNEAKINNNSPELMFNAARKRAQRAEVSSLDLNYSRAGRHYSNAHRMTPVDYKEHRLGYLLRASRNYLEADLLDDSLAMARNAVNVAEESFGKNHQFVAEALNNLGNSFSQAKRYDDAILAYQRSLAILESVYGQSSLSVGETLSYLANTYVNNRQLQQSIEPYQKSLHIFESNLGSLNDQVISTLNSLVNVFRVLGRFNEAEQLIKRYITKLESQPKSQQGNKLAMVINSLGLLYMDNGRFQEAEQRLSRALTLTQELHGPEHPEVARTLNNLANLYTRTENFSKSIELLRQALRIVKSCYPDSHPNVQLVMKNFNAVSNRRLTQA